MALGVEFKDDHLDGRADLGHFLGMGNVAFPVELADMDKALEPRSQLDEGTEILQARDFALVGLTGFEVRHSIGPGIARSLLQ